MKNRVIAIGASWNGILALSALVAALPSDLPAAVLVVQHTSPDGPGLLPSVLSRAGPLPAVHPRDMEIIEPGRIYVAPPDRHMLVRKGGYLHLSHGPRENYTRPAVDPTFRSAALVYGSAAVGVVLTGHLDDGTAGLLAIKDCGGVTIVQDPREAGAPSMPSSALRHVAVDHRGTIAEIAACIVMLARDAPGEARSGPLQQILEIEARIDEGIYRAEDWLRMESRCVASGLNCPECRSALYELPDPRLLRYRCRAGHAFTARGLLSGQAAVRDQLLASLFGALTEEASLARRWAASDDASTDPGLREHLDARLAQMDHRARQVCDWLAEPPLDR
jgi:two-component system chemotaxis response regulator CheB